MNSLAYFALAGCMLSAALGAVIVCVLVSGCGLAWNDGQPEDDRRRSRVTRVGHAAAGLSFFFAALFALVALAGASSDLPSRLQALRPAVTGIAVTLSRISDVAERLRSRVDHPTVRPAGVDPEMSGSNRERLDRGLDRETTRPVRSAELARVERLELVEPPRQLSASPAAHASTGNGTMGTEVSRRLADPSPASSAVASPTPAPRPRPEIRDTSINTVRVEPGIPAVTPAPPRVDPVQPVAPDMGQLPVDKPRVAKGDTSRIDKDDHAVVDKMDRGDGGEFARNAIEDTVVRSGQDTQDRRERPTTERPKGGDRDNGRRVRTESLHRVDDRSDRVSRDRVERTARSEGPNRVERADRVERVERVERPDKVDRVERVERVERPQRIERAERPERREKIERIERSGRR